MDGITELAKLFKERENANFMGMQVGRVININPLKISLGDKIILDVDDLIIAETAYYKYELINGTLKQVIKLFIGAEVILVPSTDEQTYFLIDKVVDI